MLFIEQDNIRILHAIWLDHNGAKNLVSCYTNQNMVPKRSSKIRTTKSQPGGWKKSKKSINVEGGNVSGGWNFFFQVSKRLLEI